MKADIFFTLDSFCFVGEIENLIDELTKASVLVDKMYSDKFIRFSTSSDFYDSVVSMLYGAQKIPEAGVLSSLLYDGRFNLAINRDFDSSEVVRIVNEDFPVIEQRWLSIFGILPPNVMINNPVRNVRDEKGIIEFSKEILRENVLDSIQYSEAFQGIYRNLIFHPDYNDLDNISGGYKSFLEGIFEMFDEMNAHEPQGGHPKTDIDYLDSKIKFKTCEEGGSKKNRKGEKKLDFLFTIKGIEKSYNCEYHCKLEFFDNQYKTGHYYGNNRMYFGFYKPDLGRNQFLIAHLGGHL